MHFLTNKPSGNSILVVQKVGSLGSLQIGDCEICRLKEKRGEKLTCFVFVDCLGLTGNRGAFCESLLASGGSPTRRGRRPSVAKKDLVFVVDQT